MDTDHGEILNQMSESEFSEQLLPEYFDGGGVCCTGKRQGVSAYGAFDRKTQGLYRFWKFFVYRKYGEDC